MNNPFQFDTRYRTLPESFYTNIRPARVRSPALVLFNDALAKQIHLSEISDADKTQIFSGNRLPAGVEPLAQAYAGHQFGYFNMLGDGRAHLLGEHLTADGTRLDVQLKGSGQTPYSRRGDGRAAIGPMLREYLISEAMHALQIPTTRSLAVVLTGEPVFRETPLPGAILTRIAASHLRVGTFQFAAAQPHNDWIQPLLDYTVDRHYSHLRESPTKAMDFLQAVMEKQIDLIVDWMRVGFIHGVMNTDNTAISGETIDYGPCAFMDAYNPKTVFSSIDRTGRYAYANQPVILQWNLARLAETLLPLIHNDLNQAIDSAKALLTRFDEVYSQRWNTMMRRKLGLIHELPEDSALVRDLLNWMEKTKADYTNTFLTLTNLGLETAPQHADPEWRVWLERWQQRRTHPAENRELSQQMMQQSNPAVIPRNHQVEAALEQAQDGDLNPFKQLLAVLQDPYNQRPEIASYQNPPKPSNRVYQTFCGT